MLAQKIANVEIVRDQLFLVNRGNNFLIKYELSEIIDFLEGISTTLPVAGLYPIILPEYKGVKAGFSGLAKSEDQNSLVFTASLEKTSNWIDDGEILGSYIGEINLHNLPFEVTNIELVRDAHGNPINHKLESIVMLPIHSQMPFNAVTVGDNDDGTSVFITLKRNR